MNRVRPTLASPRPGARPRPKCRDRASTQRSSTRRGRKSIATSAARSVLAVQRRHGGRVGGRRGNRSPPRRPSPASRSCCCRPCRGSGTSPRRSRSSRHGRRRRRPPRLNCRRPTNLARRRAPYRHLQQQTGAPHGMRRRLGTRAHALPKHRPRSLLRRLPHRLSLHPPNLATSNHCAAGRRRPRPHRPRQASPPRPSPRSANHSTQ